MKHCISNWMLANALICISTASADPLPQEQVAFTAGASSTWNADWAGADHRIYFFQWSLDLGTWQHAPFMEFGTGSKSYGLATSNAPKIFVRLAYYDDPSVETLAQAMNADFDNDGVSNINEVNSLGTNPFLFSTNGSGISDGVQDWDGDGISNADEVALGLDPGTDNTGAAAGTTAKVLTYDDKHRLTGSASPATTQIFTLDAEGNITGQ